MTPSSDLPLVGGMTIKFNSVVLAHRIPTQSTVALIIQATDGSVLGVSEVTPIFENKIIELSVVAKIPPSTSISAFFPLYLNGVSESIAVDFRVYEIISSFNK
jgi:hypothetical protein